jgi:hypothetical protein
MRPSRSSRFRSTLVLAMALATTACIAPPAPLEPNGAWQFSGAISNLAGGNIAGARLTVMNGPNQDAQATTDAQGRFVFPSLEAGSFGVLIEASGFRSITPHVELFRDIVANFALSAVP